MGNIKGPRKLKLVSFASVEYKSNIDTKEANVEAKQEISDNIYEVEESSEEENVPNHDEYDYSQESMFAVDNPLDLSEYDGFIAKHSDHAETEMADAYKAKELIMNQYDNEDNVDVAEVNAIESTETDQIKDLAIQDHQNNRESLKNEENLVQLTNDYYNNFDASYDLKIK